MMQVMVAAAALAVVAKFLICAVSLILCEVHASALMSLVMPLQ